MARSALLAVTMIERNIHLSYSKLGRATAPAIRGAPTPGLIVIGAYGFGSGRTCGPR